MEKDKKKVLLVSAGDVNRGGVQTFLLTWVRQMPKESYDVSWYFPGDIEDEVFAQEFRREGVKILAGKSVFTDGMLAKVRRYVDEWHSIRRLMQTEQYDIVHINTGSLSYQSFIALAASSCGVPLRIAHSHNSMGGEGHFRKFVNHFLRFALVHTANRFASCSRKAAEYLFGKHIGAKALIIKNCIDTKKFAFSPEARESIRRDLGLEGCFVIGHVGRFNPQKNHQFLIRVFEAVAQKEPSARLLLVGGGELEKDIRKQVENAGLSEKVIFAGITDCVQDYMSAMDVFVLPSLYEGFPVVGIEAQANGLSCVFSDTITREVDIADRACFLTIVNDVQIWVDTISTFKMYVKQERKGKWLDLKMNGYDIESINEDYTSLYE